MLNIHRFMSCAENFPLMNCHIPKNYTPNYKIAIRTQYTEGGYEPPVLKYLIVRQTTMSGNHAVYIALFGG